MEGNEIEENADVVLGWIVDSVVLDVVTDGAVDPNEKVGPGAFESAVLPDGTNGVVPNENIGTGGLASELVETSVA